MRQVRQKVRTMKLCIYGTRPEEIKLYPFQKYGFKFLQVNQSKDLHQGLVKPDYYCEEEGLIHTIRMLRPSLVIVQGDTRTAFNGALYAYQEKIPVAHVEAGLRTWDINDPHPEEGYRQMIDCISTYKFCSTPEATKNCDGIYVGQTSIDTLFEFIPDCTEEDFYIVTVHRTDISKVLPTLKKMDVTKLKIIAHPNKYGQELRKHFVCIDPVNYRLFVDLLARSKGCISDSGGLQEECLALGKEYISLRDKSERGKGETYKKGATKLIVETLNE
jgi:UDP-N-acetylglucosamine 2-epimerase (non-hydrolysing)